MGKNTVSNGWQITDDDIALIQRLIEDNPSWTRTRLSRELCRAWRWYVPNGATKDMLCRTLLRKLHTRNLIDLPGPVHGGNNRYRNRTIPPILHITEPIAESLGSLLPLRITNVAKGGYHYDLFRCLLHRYHYLGYKGCPGESIPYVVFDNRERPLACLLFAAAAWKIQARDSLIGWNPATREHNLLYLKVSQTTVFCRLESFYMYRSAVRQIFL